jgi:RNA-directed DNA polymerase
MATSTTRRGGEMATTGVERIAPRARQEPHTRYTSLMHHFTVGNLRAGVASLAGKNATGVDGVTKALYGQPLEDNRQALHRKLPQRVYRPQPVRRVEMPKDNGGTRPLGSSCLEDQIVQAMARRILEALSEPVLLDTS